MKDIKVACIQISPIYLNPDATTDKIGKFLEKTSKKEPDLVVFPELVLSGYPNFYLSSLEYRKRYNLASIKRDSPQLDKISKVVEDLGVVCVLGLIEQDPLYDEVIYDSSCVMDSDGSIIGFHRKIAPFGAEKIIFKPGDARDIRIFETRVGKIGIGLCFENFNPLYRKALSLMGEDIHCALWVTTEESRNIIESSARVTGVEGGVFVALASQVTKHRDPLERGLAFIGGSSILDPMGNFLADPVYNKEKIVYADLEPKVWNIQKFQSRGIEARDDLLSLNLRAEAYKPLNIKFDEMEELK
jgi:predicted amidohydrolase